MGGCHEWLLGNFANGFSRNGYLGMGFKLWMCSHVVRDDVVRNDFRAWLYEWVPFPIVPHFFQFQKLD